MPIHTYTLDHSLVDVETFGTSARHIQDQAVIDAYWELRNEGIISDDNTSGITVNHNYVTGESTVNLNVSDGHDSDTSLTTVKNYFSNVWSQGNV